MLLRLTLTILLIVLFIPSYLLAANNSPKNMLDIDKVCRKSPTDCLSEVNQKLQQTHIQSRVWYDLMQYKFETLLVLQKDNELHKITKTWINKKNLPIPFQLSLLIYYGKTLDADTTLDKEKIKQERKKIMGEAQILLKLMNNAYPNPNLLIQFANLQLYVGEYKKAYQLLQSLVVKYENYPDLIFHADLYANLGHLADRLSYKKQAVKYWSASLYWEKQVGNDQQIAVLYYNLARSQMWDKNFTNAKFNAEKSIYHATLGCDYIEQAQAQLLTVKILLILKQKTQAKKMLDSIKINTLPESSLNEFTQLKTQM